MTVEAQRVENLGPAERIIDVLTSYTSHLYHGRPGYVVKDSSEVGVKWHPVTHKVNEDGTKTVFRLDKVGDKTKKTPLGVLGADFQIRDGSTVVGEYRKPGISPEVATYLYGQIAKVWEMDNEFAARWASYTYNQKHRDMKVLLAAFMLVQSRCGTPIRENGSILFNDDDHREVGEAMVLIKRKDNLDLDPKGIWRIFEVLSVPGIAAINRQLGFGNSARNPALGRLPKAVAKWLTYRENNLPLFQGLVKKGWKTTVKQLCKKVGFKPGTPQFFQVLRWKQEQAPDGRRVLGIGDAVAEADSWNGLTERQICEKITQEKLSYKKIVGLLPKDIGLTRAIMAASVMSGALSNTDLLILTPTLEELGLLGHAAVKPKYDAALLGAESQRAANIAKRVKHKENSEKLQDAAAGAMKKAVEEAVKDMRVYVVVDKSGSMEGALERAKQYLIQFLAGFPLDKVHISTFNTHGKEIKLKGTSATGVAQAFMGERAGGGTCYASGVNALIKHPPKDDEDSIIIFIGDQADSGYGNFAPTIERSGLRPSAFGLLEVEGQYGLGKAVEETASRLGIPCFRIEEDTFSDPYSVPRTIANLIASTPVGEQTVPGRVRVPRITLVETILNHDLLKKPAWA